MGTSFKDTIEEHLQLKERNRGIETTMPLSRYRTADQPAGHGELDRDASAGGTGIPEPDGADDWPTAEGLGLELPGSLWAGPPSFDWGD